MVNGGNIEVLQTKAKTIGTTSKRMMMKKAMRQKVTNNVSARLAKRHVFFGKISKTACGLKKTDLVRNRTGKVVSKKRSARTSLDVK